MKATVQIGAALAARTRMVRGRAAAAALAMLLAALPAAAQSTERDSPTPLESGVVEVSTTGQGGVFYYEFPAGPGEVTVTVDAKTDYYSTPVRVAFTAPDGRELGDVYVVANDGGRRGSTAFRLAAKTRVVMQVRLEADEAVKTLDYTIRLGGATRFGPKALGRARLTL